MVTKNWLNVIDQNPLLARLASDSPRLMQKVQRFYLNRAFRPKARLAALTDHYAFINRFLPSPWTEQLLFGPHHVLAQLPTRHGHIYELCLTRTDKFDREGELLLTLINQTMRQQVFYSAFSVIGKEATMSLAIGCIQGPSPVNGKQLIKQATKDFHGLRPKNLILQSIYTIAQCWGITKILAIPDKQQVFGNRFTYFNPIHTNYDEFWQELGGVPIRDLWFKLPNSMTRRPVEDVRSKHRAEYRRRTAFSESLIEQIHASLPVA